MFSPSVRAVIQLIVAARTGEAHYAQSFSRWPATLAAIEDGTVELEAPSALADRWVASGVLLLNTSLTLSRFRREGDPHQVRGHLPLWRPLMVRVLDHLAGRRAPVVIIVFGDAAAETLVAAALSEADAGDRRSVSSSAPAPGCGRRDPRAGEPVHTLQQAPSDDGRPAGGLVADAARAGSRLHHRGRRLGGMRAGEPALGRPRLLRAPHRGRRQGSQSPVPPADADGQAVPLRHLQLALPHRAGAEPRRPLALLAARQGAGRLVHHQRHGLRARQSPRLRPVGANGPHRLVLRGRAARVPPLRGACGARRGLSRQRTASSPSAVRAAPTRSSTHSSRRAARRVIPSTTTSTGPGSRASAATTSPSGGAGAVPPRRPSCAPSGIAPIWRSPPIAWCAAWSSRVAAPRGSRFPTVPAFGPSAPSARSSSAAARSTRRRFSCSPASGPATSWDGTAFPWSTSSPASDATCRTMSTASSPTPAPSPSPSTGTCGPTGYPAR